MKTAASQRSLTSLVCALVLLIVAAACGGSSHSSSTSVAGNSIANPNGSSGSSNSGSTGSSNSGSNGGSGGGTSSSTGATYVYAPIYADQGGVEGFKQDVSGTFAALPGSPLVPQGAGGMGALAAYNGNVYIANYKDMTGDAQLLQYKVNSADGSLTPAGTISATTPGQGDTGLHNLWVNSKKNVMYGVFQWTVVTYGFDGNGTPSIISSTKPSTDDVVGFDFLPNGPYAYAAIQNGNPKQGFQQPQIMLLTMASDGSVTTSRAVATLSGNLVGFLKIDPTGKYVVVEDGMNTNELRVFAIQADGSLTEVAGSPFSTGTEYIGPMSFDASGKFLYIASQSPAFPQPENLQAYSFDPSSGKLTQIQNIAEPDNQNLFWVTVDGDFLYLTNSQGGTQSTITVYTRDPNTGLLTQAAVNNIARPVGQTETLHF